MLNLIKNFHSSAKEAFIKILVKNLKVKEIVVGEDFCFGKGREGSLKDLSDNDIKMNIQNKVIMNSNRVSSTLIRQSFSS